MDRQVSLSSCMSIKTFFFLSDFLLYQYSDFCIILYYTVFWKINEKNREKNKNKLRTIYPKNHENFKNNKPKVQFYWFFIKKECIENIILAMPESRLEQTGSRLAKTRWKTSWLHINVTTNLWTNDYILLISFIVPSRLSYKQPLSIILLPEITIDSDNAEVAIEITFQRDML